MRQAKIPFGNTNLMITPLPKTLQLHLTSLFTKLAEPCKFGPWLPAQNLCTWSLFPFLCHHSRRLPAPRQGPLLHPGPSCRLLSVGGQPYVLYNLNDTHSLGLSNTYPFLQNAFSRPGLGKALFLCVLIVLGSCSSKTIVVICLHSSLAYTLWKQ